MMNNRDPNHRPDHDRRRRKKETEYGVYFVSWLASVNRARRLTHLWICHLDLGVALHNQLLDAVQL